MLVLNGVHLRMLARTLLAGDPGLHAIAARITCLLGRPRRWIPRLASSYVAHFGAGIRPSQNDAHALLAAAQNSAAFEQASAVAIESCTLADDLAFSGGAAFEKVVERFSTHVGALLQEENFVVHHRKTRIMRQGVRQYLAGLVTNERLNVPRPDFDRLKAILTNCVRFGPETQNRDRVPEFRLHLAGRIAFVESVNLAKGNRLRRIFEQIIWPNV